MAKIARHELGPDDVQAMFDGRGLLAGPPVEAIQLRIMPDRWGTPVGPYSGADFAAVCCPPGEAGEIVVSGDHVLPGYLHGQGDRETKFRVDEAIWHRTGDAGYLDAAGRLWLLGRCAARIKDELGTLYPFAAECALTHRPEVRRAAVLTHRGRRVAAVELYDQAAPASIQALKERLAWAHIDEIRVLKQIPVDKRHNAKVDYPALKRVIGEL